MVARKDVFVGEGFCCGLAASRSRSLLITHAGSAASWPLECRLGGDQNSNAYPASPVDADLLISLP